MAAAAEHRFTVIVRLPFRRGDFVDPPPVRVYPFSMLRLLLNDIGGMECSQREGVMGNHFSTIQNQ